MTESRWAKRPSASAMVSMVGERDSSPSRDRICTVEVFMNMETFRPEQVLAYPDVGSTWFVPEA